MGDSPYWKRWRGLVEERSSWDAHWREIGDYMLPRRPRFVQTDSKRGGKRNDRILNNTPTHALRTLSAGMVAGLTSPARPWFRLAVGEPGWLSRSAGSRAWIEGVETVIREMFLRSNLYTSLGSVYEDCGAFCTASMFVDEDPLELMRCYVQPIGSYCLTEDSRSRVNGLWRQVCFTVDQAVERWPDTVSEQTRRLHEQGQLDKSIEVLHVVQPNGAMRYGRADASGKPWKSCWIEKGAQDGALLSEGGYWEFPVMAPRWSIRDGDVWGTGPGMDCLEDVKALQVLEKRKALALEKMVNPPMAGPSTLKTSQPSTLPGSLTVYDAAAGTPRYEPAHTVHPGVLAVQGEIQAHENRIQRGFYTDLFLMLAQSDRREITAREVDELHEEKIWQLGPVHERLSDDLLDQLIDRAFGIAMRRGLIPPAPPELQGVELRVEYVSVMAQAQKLVGVGQVERLVRFVGGVAQFEPSAMQKLDTDAVVDEYAGMLGTPSKLVRTADQVGAVREAQRQQMEMQKMADAAPAVLDAAKAARQLSGAQMGGDTALSRVVGAA